MNVMPVILWTDALIFALLAAAGVLVWFIRRQEHLLAPWRAVAQRPMAMGAALVLGVFVVIGLLDSLHYRERLADSPPDAPQYSVEVLSVFDALVSGLRTRQEKTYSAPLAMQLYAKEFVERDGVTVRDYPRLRYGGAHLKQADDHRLDMLVSVAAGIGSGARWYRTIFLEEIGKDYVRTARAKGLSEIRVLFRHVLKNGMIPILTGVVVVLPLLFMGSLITESFFGIPGLGSYTIDAIQAQDFAVVRAMVFLGSFLYIVGLILTDISYSWVDPRVRLQ
ncbi:MAG: ABC transporter permease [Candidatus Thermoplasmatota archaeon]|nr:ABC transporter permease [Candidatus Thermoplasmatota archaeon]